MFVSYSPQWQHYQTESITVRSFPMFLLIYYCIQIVDASTHL